MQKQHLAGVGKTHFSSSAFSPQNLKSCFFVAFIPASPRLDLSPVSRYLTKREIPLTIALFPSSWSIISGRFDCVTATLIHNSSVFFFTTPQPRTRMVAEDEDDYMSMVIEEPQQKETFTQKKRRLQREASPPPSPHYHAAIIKPQTFPNLTPSVLITGRSPRKSPLQSRTCRTGSR